MTKEKMIKALERIGKEYKNEAGNRALLYITWATRPFGISEKVLIDVFPDAVEGLAERIGNDSYGVVATRLEDGYLPTWTAVWFDRSPNPAGQLTASMRELGLEYDEDGQVYYLKQLGWRHWQSWSLDQVARELEEEEEEDED